MPESMYLRCAWWLRKPEEGIESPETRVRIVVRHHVGSLEEQLVILKR